MSLLPGACEQVFPVEEKDDDDADDDFCPVLNRPPDV